MANSLEIGLKREPMSTPITFIPGNSVLGCALVQLTDTRELKFQAIKGTSCSSGEWIYG